METTAVRKKRRTIPVETNGESPTKSSIPEKGPYCPRCKYEYGNQLDKGGESTQIAAMLAHEGGLSIECPKCHRKDTPVLGFEDPENKPPPPKSAPIEPGVRRIIESVFQVDYEASWKKLHEALVIGDKRNDHATVTKHLDLVEDRAREAHQLYVNMRIELERFLIDHEIIWAAMWDEANAKLQAEKAKGERSKQITDADVRYKMAEQHPDQFKHQEIQKKQFELAVKHAESFAGRWEQKARDIGVILGKMKS